MGGGQERTGVPRRKRMGVANEMYFRPGPISILPLRRVVIESSRPPEILTEKIITFSEVEELFKIYFDYCHRHNCLLDPGFHTPKMVSSRSPFLFTCICAVAARVYERKDLHVKCLVAAKKIAFDVMTRGYKSVEIVQGFLLLSLWNQPAERFEEDRTWAFVGIAVRMGVDLNLHRKTTSRLAPDTDPSALEQYEREILNRERTWLYCYIADRSLSFQMGKPYSISKEDFIIRNSKTWYQQSQSTVGDSALMAMVEIHKINTRLLDTIYSDVNSLGGMNKSLDFEVIVRTYGAAYDEWRDVFTDKFEEGGYRPEDDEMRQGYRWTMKFFYYNYYKLLLYSFAFQAALDNRDPSTPTLSPDLTALFPPCYKYATTLLHIVRDALAPNKYLRTAPDAQFVFTSYACVFLLKLIRPEFNHIVTEEEILKLVGEVVECLEKVSVDEEHTPFLYASFLRMLIENRRQGGSGGSTVGSASRASRSRAGSLNDEIPIGGLGVSSDSAEGMRPTTPNVVVGGGEGVGNSSAWKEPVSLSGGGGEEADGMGDVRMMDGTSASGGIQMQQQFPRQFQASNFMQQSANQENFQNANNGNNNNNNGIGNFNQPPQLAGPTGGGTDWQNLAVDNLLESQSFWDSFLLPGFQGTMGLSAGGLHDGFESNWSNLPNGNLNPNNFNGAGMGQSFGNGVFMGSTGPGMGDYDGAHGGMRF